MENTHPINQASKLEENVLLIASQLPLVYSILYEMDLDTLKLTLGVHLGEVSRHRTVGFLFDKPFDLAPKQAIEEAKLKRIRATYDLCKILHETDEILRESKQQIKDNENLNPFKSNSL